MSIRCSQGHENPDDATFCDECGEPLPVVAAASDASAEEEAPTLPAADAGAPEPVDLAVPQPAPAVDFEATQVAPDTQVSPPPAAEESPTVTAVPSEPPPLPAFVPEPVAPPAPPEPVVPPAPPEPELELPGLLVVLLVGLLMDFW